MGSTYHALANVNRSSEYFWDLTKKVRLRWHSSSSSHDSLRPSLQPPPPPRPPPHYHPAAAAAATLPRRHRRRGRRCPPPPHHHAITPPLPRAVADPPLVHQYGPTWTVNLPMYRIIAITDPKSVEHILKTNFEVRLLSCLVQGPGLRCPSARAELREGPQVPRDHERSSRRRHLRGGWPGMDDPAQDGQPHVPQR